MLASALVSQEVRVCIAMPVYDDWESAAILCGQLERELAGRPERFEILIVDDGSTAPRPAYLEPSQLVRPFDVSVLELTRNLGHQSAIAIALAYLHDHGPGDAVVVMDADGEDRAEDVPRLLDGLHETGARSIVFAERRRRIEGLLFRAGYQAYRGLHRAATGLSVQVGNFSAIPARYLARVALNPDVWANYSASVFAARLPVHLVAADRGRRISGHSHMNYVRLVAHGLAALSVHRHRIGARSLLAMSVLTLALGAALAAAGAIGVARGTPLPLSTLAMLALLIVLVAMTGFGFALAMFADRRNRAFAPARDYRLFVRALRSRTRPPLSTSAAIRG